MRSQTEHLRVTPIFNSRNVLQNRPACNLYFFTNQTAIENAERSRGSLGVLCELTSFDEEYRTYSNNRGASSYVCLTVLSS